MHNNLYGFEKVTDQFITELDTEVVIYKHTKTAAKLLHIPNNDTNKVFNIQFVTLPQDDTGIAHILEHSVLAGSENYPLKEPFVNLLKGSLNTFLNAMTFPDKTMYPFASQNDKDFLNILDIYLDAVFAPKIKNDSLILRQEGWRYEQFSEDEKLQYNGIVFNEMKGVMSSPDSRLDQICRKALFDNTYQYNSGGQPQSIVDLTEETFLEFYRQNYHPSNSYIYLYGDIALEPVLKVLNNRFKHFDLLKNLPKNIGTSLVEDAQYKRGVYPGQETDLRYAQIQIVLPGNKMSRSITEEYAMQLISLALFNMESSTLRQNIIEQGLARDIYSHADFSSYNPNLTILLVGVPDMSPQKLEKVIWQELKNSLKNYDREVFHAALNTISFTLREGDSRSTPEGLVRGINSLINWPYGRSPLDTLAYEKHLSALNESLDTNYFIDLFNKSIIDNTHRVTAIIAPEEAEAKKILLQEQDKLKKNYSRLSKSQKSNIIKVNHALKKKQNTPDSQEALASLPSLSRSDLKNKHSYQDLNKDLLTLDKSKKIPLLTFFGFSRSITYLSLHFDLKEITQDQLFELSVLREILGNIDTENFSYQELTNYSLSNTGGINLNLIYTEHRQYLELKIKLLNEQINHGLNLIEEILLGSNFKASKKRIYELLTSKYSRMQLNLVDNAIGLARRRLKSYLNVSGKFYEQTGGIHFYKKLGNLINNWDSLGDEFILSLSNLMQKLIKQNHLTIYYAGEESNWVNIKSKVKSSIGKFPRSDYEIDSQIWTFEFKQENEAFIIPSDVQFAIAGNNLKKINPSWKFNGSLQVLQQIINTDYLWNQVRVKGGAYGASMSIDRSGNLLLSSYRDPECAKTYQVYNDLPNYINQLNLTESDLTSYLIGTFSTLDQPLSFPSAATRAKAWYDRKITLESLQREREQILQTDIHELKKHAELINKALAENIRCVLGNSEKLKEDKLLFKSTKSLHAE